MAKRQSKTHSMRSVKMVKHGFVLCSCLVPSYCRQQLAHMFRDYPQRSKSRIKVWGLDCDSGV